jgi:hypothetical protein
MLKSRRRNLDSILEEIKEKIGYAKDEKNPIEGEKGAKMFITHINSI